MWFTGGMFFSHSADHLLFTEIISHVCHRVKKASFPWMCLIACLHICPVGKYWVLTVVSDTEGYPTIMWSHVKGDTDWTQWWQVQWHAVTSVSHRRLAGTRARPIIALWSSLFAYSCQLITGSDTCIGDARSTVNDWPTLVHYKACTVSLRGQVHPWHWWASIVLQNWHWAVINPDTRPASVSLGKWQGHDLINRL